MNIVVKKAIHLLKKLIFMIIQMSDNWITSCRKWKTKIKGNNILKQVNQAQLIQLKNKTK